VVIYKQNLKLMHLPAQIAKHLRELHFGGNWTSVNLQEVLKDISWQQATTVLPSFNTVASLVFHINYYVSEVTKVLQGQPLTASDTFSFACPSISSAKDWDDLKSKVFTDAEIFATLIEQLPEEKLAANFSGEKYGSYYRNLQGIIEHTHYHLGQIVLLKKLLLQPGINNQQ
jgi:hypothetical protein